MNRSSRCLPRLFLLLLPLVLLALPSRAVASITTGVIKGTTVDEQGLPIPGVLVTARSDNLIGGAQQRETDANGRFAFFELAPGDYELSAEKPGFSRVVKPNLLVRIGRTTTVTITMPLHEAGEEIVVEESRPTIDTEQTSKGEVLSRDFLQRIPSGRDYQSAASATPGVVGSGNPYVSGAGYAENTYMLDGVNITDPVTGTFSLNFNYDAIEQLEVKTSGLDPEYGEGLGGVLNIVTESGSNRLEFDISAWYENGNWSPKTDARYGADGLEIAPSGFDSQYDVFELNSKVSGPVVRDRAWFILTYRHVRSLIANVGIDLPRDYDGHYLMGKLTMQPNTAHRFTLLGTTNPTTIDNIDQSDRYVDPEAQGRQAQGGYVGSLQWDWFISPETFLETKLTMQKMYIEVYGVPCTHDQDLGYHPCEPDEQENSLDLETPGRFGSYHAYDSDNWYQYYFDDRYRYNLTSKFNLLQVDFAGMHDLKTGVELDRTRWDQVVGYTGNLLFFDVNAVTYSPDTYTNYYWAETSGPYHAIATGDHVGWFLQDAYKPIQNLTIRYGVRYDRTVQRNDQGESVIDVGLWGPRAFAAWDPWADGKTVIRGGYGRVNDTGRLAVASFNSQANTFGYKYYVGELFDNYESSGPNNFSEYEKEEQDTVWSEMVAPHADEFLLGAQRELVQDLALGVSFTARLTTNIYEYDETNLIWDDDGYGIIGTANGEYEAIYRLRTPQVARRDYYQADVQLKKNFADRWQMLATYSYVVSQGLLQNSISGTLVNPEQVDYYYGNLYTDMRHQVKASASWDLPNDPWTTQLGAKVEYYSGWPYSRYYYSDYAGGYGMLEDNRGTYTRTQPIWWLDILFQQSIPVRKGDLYAILQVENVFNNQYADSRNSSYVYAYNRWVISSRQEPMRFTVAARYQF